MSQMTVSKLAQRQKHIDAAWKRFDKAQADIEDELRRPGRKIDVMSDEEYSRMMRSGHLYRIWLDPLYRVFCQRDRFMEHDIKEFMTTNFLSEDATDEQKKTVSTVAEFLTDLLVTISMVLAGVDYSLGTWSSQPFDNENERQGAAYDLENSLGPPVRESMHKGIYEYQGSFRDCVSKEKSLHENIVQGLKFALETDGVLDANEKAVVRKLVDDKENQDAFVTCCTTTSLVWASLPRVMISVINRLKEMRKEGGDAVPEGEFLPEGKEALKGIEKFLEEEGKDVRFFRKVMLEDTRMHFLVSGKYEF